LTPNSFFNALGREASAIPLDGIKIAAAYSGANASRIPGGRSGSELNREPTTVCGVSPGVCEKPLLIGIGKAELQIGS